MSDIAAQLGIKYDTLRRRVSDSRKRHPSLWPYKGKTAHMPDMRMDDIKCGDCNRWFRVLADDFDELSCPYCMGEQVERMRGVQVG